MKYGIKQIVMAGLWAFYTIFSAPAGSAAESAEDWYRQAFEKADSQPQEAIHAYRKALELKPHWAEAHHSLAVLYYQTNDGVRAIDQLRKAKFYYQQRTDPQAVKNLTIVINNLKRAYQKLQLNPEDFDQLSEIVDNTGNQPLLTEEMDPKIIIRLSGNPDFPGELSLQNGGKKIKHLCFLGTKARGLVNMKFLNILAKEGIPEGEYHVSSPAADEDWPTNSFSANGALRLKAISESALAQLRGANKTGVAIHGRDFYPLLEGHVDKKKMIDFFNHVLFERLEKHWGPLGISNWDMGRLHDFWKRNTNSPEQWKATVTAADVEEIRRTCKPPDAKRKLD